MQEGPSKRTNIFNVYVIKRKEIPEKQDGLGPGVDKVPQTEGEKYFKKKYYFKKKQLFQEEIILYYCQM